MTEIETPEAEAAGAVTVAPGSDPTGREAARRVASGTQRATGDDVRVADDDDGTREALDRVGAGSRDDDDVAAATEWLLSDEQQVNTKKLIIRIGGSDDAPVTAGWVVRAIGVDVIRAAEREAVSGNRSQRRSGESGYDELKANLRVVAEGTVEPDVKALAVSRGLSDPIVLLRERFKYRSGVLTQIAGEIMALSGFDSDDVRAAGNS